MTNTEALEILEQYQAWRRGADTEMLEPKDIGKAIDVAIDALKRTQWQPIETAPRDGKRILLYRPLAYETNDPIIAIFRGTAKDHGCWDETVPDGYTSENYTDGHCKATYWMPLPPAP